MVAKPGHGETGEGGLQRLQRQKPAEVHLGRTHTGHVPVDHGERCVGVGSEDHVAEAHVAPEERRGRFHLRSVGPTPPQSLGQGGGWGGLGGPEEVVVPVIQLGGEPGPQTQTLVVGPVNRHDRRQEGIPQRAPSVVAGQAQQPAISGGELAGDRPGHTGHGHEGIAEERRVGLVAGGPRHGNPRRPHRVLHRRLLR